jgi:hypothetical protein
VNLKAASKVIRPLPSARLKLWLYRIPLVSCIALFLTHLVLIWKHAVNIPAWDDWTLIYLDHPASLSWRWLFEQANEHRTSTTKFFVWLEYQLNHWNLRTHQIIAILIYGLFLILLIRFARRFAPQVPAWIEYSFVIFLLSTIVWLNHIEGYGAANHFWMIFFFAAAFVLFGERQQSLNLLGGSALAILSIYSFAAGFVACLILLIIFGFFKTQRAVRMRTTLERRKELMQLLLVAIIIGGALAVWTIDYHRAGNVPAATPPYSPRFWQLLLNLISFSFGIDRFSAVWGAVCLLIILAPLVGMVWRSGGRLAAGEWATLAASLSILAVHSAIAMGRAFNFAFAKNQEYAEHGMPLILLSVMAWSFFLKDRNNLRRAILVSLWCFCFVAFSNNWHFRIYRDVGAQRRAGFECVKAYYFEHGAPTCPTIYPPANPLAGSMDLARKLNLSFYHEMRSQYEAPH